MERTEHWIYILLILGWIASVSRGATLHGFVHLLPLMAVLILANRLKRGAPAAVSAASAQSNGRQVRRPLPSRSSAISASDQRT